MSCNQRINLVCDATAKAIALENPSALTRPAIGGLAAGDSVDSTVTAKGLWRTVRITYVAITGATYDDVQVELYISGIRVAGPFLGGELTSGNANACSIFTCEKGYCAGPIEDVVVRATNIGGAAFGATDTLKVRLTFDYENIVGQDDDAACGPCGGKPQIITPTPDNVPEGYVPVWLPPQTAADVASALEGADQARIFKYNSGRWSCRELIIPVKQKDGTYKPMGGISCKQS